MPSTKAPPKPAQAMPGFVFPEDETVWMACRATQGCPGNKTKVEMKQKLPSGGTYLKYKCLTCGKGFGVVV